MALDKPNIVDAIGIEKDTGAIILTITDSWDWSNEQKHLLALQAKLNAYFDFIEKGEIWESYPDAAGRQIVIDVIERFPIPQIGTDLQKRAEEACGDLGIKIRSRHCNGSTNE